jgi:aspartate carbamoyltransferase regulatory subunit
MSQEVKVRKIKSGTVIDHITGGEALNVLKILGVTEAYPKATVTVAMNVPSKAMGLKDIVKIEGRELVASEVDKIALIAPKATINFIRDYRVVEKKKVQIPSVIEGILRCVNANCVSNFEETRTRFLVEERSPIKLRCYFCERSMKGPEIVKQF